MAFQAVDNGLTTTSRKLIAIGGTGAKNATALKTFDPFPLCEKVLFLKD